MVLDVNLNECVPHTVKDLMYIRLELECPDIEQLDGATGSVHSYQIQLLP